MPAVLSRRRKVKAVTIPDFYSHDFCTAGAADLDSVNGRQLFDDVLLFNDATDGSLLYVYGLVVGEDFGVAATIWSFNGTVGNLYTQGSRVRFTQNSPPGQAWLHQVVFPATPAVNDPGPPAGAQFLTVITSGNQGGNIMLAPYPLFIVDPGYSLLVHCAMGAQQDIVGFWYLVAQQA